MFHLQETARAALLKSQILRVKYIATITTQQEIFLLLRPGNATPITYTYDSSHFFLTAVDPRGNPEASTTYHADGRLASMTDAVGDTYRYDYDLAENKTIVTNPDGGVVTVQNDAKGLLLLRIDPLDHTTRFTYDSNRNKLTETNALQQTTNYTYDARGNTASLTDPAGNIQSWTYNQFGFRSPLPISLARCKRSSSMPTQIQ